MQRKSVLLFAIGTNRWRPPVDYYASLQLTAQNDLINTSVWFLLIDLLLVTWPIILARMLSYRSETGASGTDGSVRLNHTVDSCQFLLFEVLLGVTFRHLQFRNKITQFRLIVITACSEPSKRPKLYSWSETCNFFQQLWRNKKKTNSVRSSTTCPAIWSPKGRRAPL